MRVRVSLVDFITSFSPPRNIRLGLSNTICLVSVVYHPNCSFRPIDDFPSMRHKHVRLPWPESVHGYTTLDEIEFRSHLYLSVWSTTEKPAFLDSNEFFGPIVICCIRDWAVNRNDSVDCGRIGRKLLSFGDGIETLRKGFGFNHELNQKQFAFVKIGPNEPQMDRTTLSSIIVTLCLAKTYGWTIFGHVTYTRSSDNFLRTRGFLSIEFRSVGQSSFYEFSKHFLNTEKRRPVVTAGY